MSEVRKDLKYTADHEWIMIEDGVATIGVTDFAQGELGDIVYVETDVAVGDDVSQEEVIGTIEAVKTVADIFSPVSGEVLEINEDLEDDPESLNESPYEKGWIIKIKISHDSEIESLLSSEKYAEMIGQ